MTPFTTLPASTSKHGITLTDRIALAGYRRSAAPLRFCHPHPLGNTPKDADEHLRALAEGQHALVSFEQARRHLSRHDIRRRLAGADWTLATPRVLRLVGAPSTVEQSIMAAVLDGGAGTTASYRSAAVVWRLPGVRGGSPEVTRARGRRSRPSTIAHVHFTRSLPAHHVTEVRGVPVTTLPRTLFDLAGRLPPARLERLVDAVTAKSPGTLRALHTLLAEHAVRGRDGITVMRELLQARPIGIRREESGLERRVRAILAEAGEHPLEAQVDVGGHDWIGRVDYRDPLDPTCLYEVDSVLHHTSPSDRRRDEERDAALRAAGFARVVRIPEEHVWYEPWRVIAAVRANRRRRVA